MMTNEEMERALKSAAESCTWRRGGPRATSDENKCKPRADRNKGEERRKIARRGPASGQAAEAKILCTLYASSAGPVSQVDGAIFYGLIFDRMIWYRWQSCRDD